MTAINSLCSSPVTVNLFNTKNVPMFSQQHYFLCTFIDSIQPQEETNRTVLFMYHDNFPSYTSPFAQSIVNGNVKILTSNFYQTEALDFSLIIYTMPYTLVLPYSVTN